MPMPNGITLTVAPDVLGRFPELACGGFLTDRLDSANVSQSPSYESIRESLAGEGITIEEITAEPRIAAWRAAIQASGVKASKFRGSAEQLARRVLRGGSVEAPPLVDLYCRLSALHLAPLGAYDVDRLPGTNIELRHARSGDSFEPLGSGVEVMPLAAAVPVYAVGDVVLCWLFNVRDSARTSLTPSTRRALFLSESLNPAQRQASDQALGALREALLTAGANAGGIVWTTADQKLTMPAV